MARRAKGQGNIRKRKDGRWEGRYIAAHDPETGKAVYKNVLGKTQADVLNKLKAAMAEAEELDMMRHDEYTVAQWVETWYKEYARPNIRESTSLYYHNYVYNHIIPRLGRIQLKKLRTIDIQRFYNRLRESGRLKKTKNTENMGLSNKTIRGVHMMLHNCLEQAVKERIISFNPSSGCRIPPKEHKEMKILQQDQIGSYLREADLYGVLPIFYLELSSGLRRGELLALLWSDLDIEARTITVSKSVNRINKRLVVTEPKTANSKRKVSIPEQTVEILIEEHERHPDDIYMFPSPKMGEMYDPNTIRRIHKRLLERAGIDTDVKFHDLRHTFTTMMLQSGVDPKTLSSMLGHYSTAFTLDVYSHVTNHMQEKAARKMGEIMEQMDPIIQEPEPEPEPGTPWKVKIISNGYKNGMKYNDAVEQKLTLFADGRLWFTGYRLGREHKYRIDTRKNFAVGHAEMTRLFAKLKACFLDGNYTGIAAEGEPHWLMTVETMDGSRHTFTGTMTEDVEWSGEKLSEQVRQVVGIKGLWAFEKC